MAQIPVTSHQLWLAENRLFTAWQRREPTLLRDGALGGEHSTYLQQPIRILFALKEPNDSGGRWSANGADLRLHATAFADLRSTFPVVLLLALLAQQAAIDPTLSLPFASAREQLRDRNRRLCLLESIALVNLKKTPGGPVCNDRSLLTSVEQSGDLLVRQLALYRPHLTIAGGGSVHTLLAQLTGQAVTPALTPETRPFFFDPRLGLCLSFFHPQATKGYEFLYVLLRESLLQHSDALTIKAARNEAAGNQSSGPVTQAQ